MLSVYDLGYIMMLSLQIAQVEQGGHLVDAFQGLVQHLLVMAGRDAEPDSLFQHRGERSDSHDGDTPVMEPVDDGPDLGQKENHKQYHQAVIVAVHDAAHLLQLPTEVLGVAGESWHTVCCGTVHDGIHGGNALFEQ